MRFVRLVRVNRHMLRLKLHESLCLIDHMLIKDVAQFELHFLMQLNISQFRLLKLVVATPNQELLEFKVGKMSVHRSQPRLLVLNLNRFRHMQCFIHILIAHVRQITLNECSHVFNLAGVGWVRWALFLDFLPHSL